MIDKLIELLETIGYPAFVQGSLPEAEPESFFTVWDFTTDDTSKYDNTAQSAEIGFWVYFYSVDPSLVDEVLIKARRMLEKNDYTPNNYPRSVMAHRVEYTGKFFTVYKLINYKDL